MSCENISNTVGIKAASSDASLGNVIFKDRSYTYVNSAFTGIYNASDADAVIDLCEEGTYRDLIEGSVYKSEGKKLILPLKPIRAYLLIKE